MSFRGRYRAEAETTNGPKAWRRTRSIPAPLIDLIGRSGEPGLSECFIRPRYLRASAMYLFSTAGYRWALWSTSFLLSLAVIIYLCLMVLRGTGNNRQRWCFVRVMRFAIWCYQGVFGSCVLCMRGGWLVRLNTATCARTTSTAQKTAKHPKIETFSVSQGATASNMYDSSKRGAPPSPLSGGARRPWT